MADDTFKTDATDAFATVAQKNTLAFPAAQIEEPAVRNPGSQQRAAGLGRLKKSFSISG